MFPPKDRFSRGFDGFDYSGLCVLNERRGLVLARFIGSHPLPKSPSSEESRESVFCVPSAEQKRVRALRTVQNPPETPAGLSNPGLKTTEKQQNLAKITKITRPLVRNLVPLPSAGLIYSNLSPQARSRCFCAVLVVDGGRYRARLAICTARSQNCSSLG